MFVMCLDSGICAGSRYLDATMLLVFMTSGECIEVEAAVAARVVNDEVVCFSGEGYQVASFTKTDVEAFTRDASIARLVKDEVCDEVTLIPTTDPEGETQKE